MTLPTHPPSPRRRRPPTPAAPEAPTAGTPPDALPGAPPAGGSAAPQADALYLACDRVFAPTTAPSALVPVPPGPPTPHDPRTVQEVAGVLFDRFDPTAPASWRHVVRRPVRHFYAPEVLRPLDYHLADVVTNAGRLYLQGAALGVGASVLASDFAVTFNTRAEELGDPRRVLYAQLEPGTNTPSRFFDTLGVYLKAPLSDAELRFRSPVHLALRVLTGAALLGATALIIDHVHAAPPRVRQLVGTLLRLTDPTYLATLHTAWGGEVPVRPRIAVVVVDHHLPEALFRGSPEVLLLLKNRHMVLQPYTTVTAVADALRQAGIGLDTLDLGDEDDRAFAARVLQVTSGLVAHMEPLFSDIALVADASGIARPTLECLEGALKVHRSMVDVFTKPADVPGGRLYGVYAKDVPGPPRRRPAPGADDGGASGPDATPEVPAPRARRRRTRAGDGDTARDRQLRRKGAARETAEAEGRAMRRKRHVNVAPSVAGGVP